MSDDSAVQMDPEALGGKTESVVEDNESRPAAALEDMMARATVEFANEGSGAGNIATPGA